MARSFDDILTVIRDTAPAWLRRDVEGVLLRGLARVIRASELTVDMLVSQTTREGATGPWLDAVGDAAGKTRRFIEDEDEFRERAYLSPDGPTPAALLRAVEEWLSAWPLEGYALSYFEPLWKFAPPVDADDDDDDIFADDIEAIVGPDDSPRYLSWLSVPLFETVDIDEAFADLDDDASFADGELFVDEDIDDPDRLIYRIILDEIEAHRGASRAYGVSFEDTAQPVHMALLFDLAGPVMG